MWPLCLRSQSRRRPACRLNAAQAPDFTYSCQASTEHFEQCVELALLRNRRLGALAVAVVAISLARRAAATACAAVQSTLALFSSLVTGRASRSSCCHTLTIREVP